MSPGLKVSLPCPLQNVQSPGKTSIKCNCNLKAKHSAPLTALTAFLAINSHTSQRLPQGLRSKDISVPCRSRTLRSESSRPLPLPVPRPSTPGNASQRWGKEERRSGLWNGEHKVQREKPFPRTQSAPLPSLLPQGKKSCSLAETLLPPPPRPAIPNAKLHWAARVGWGPRPAEPRVAPGPEPAHGGDQSWPLPGRGG